MALIKETMSKKYYLIFGSIILKINIKILYKSTPFITKI